MKLIYLYTAVNWYRLSLFKEINKKCDCKFVILGDFNYNKTDYKNISYIPEYSELDIVFLNDEQSKYQNLCKFLDGLTYDSIVVPSMNGWKYISLTTKLSKYLSDQGKNVLYFWEYWPLEECHASLKRRAIQWCKSLFVKRASKYIDCFITPSIYTLAYYLSLKIPSKKIYRVPNVSEFDNCIHYDIRNDYNLPADSKIILYLGRIEAYKGAEQLIFAFNECNFDNTYLFIVGSGEKNSSLNKSSNIIFTGSVSPQERYKFFSSADFFVLPNTYDKKIEAWGLTVNEALYYSLPVIVTNGTGAGFDLVFNDINGYILDSDNLKNELIEKMTWLITDDLKRKQLASNSKMISNLYSFENMATVFVYCANKKR